MMNDTICTYAETRDELLLAYLYDEIEPDDRDKDGIKLISPLMINTATIKDDAGNHASPVLHNIGA